MVMARSSNDSSDEDKRQGISISWKSITPNDPGRGLYLTDIRVAGRAIRGRAREARNVYARGGRYYSANLTGWQINQISTLISGGHFHFPAG